MFFRDNHDLSVYISWDPESIDGSPENFEDIKDHFDQNIIFLKLKSHIVWSLAAGVDILRSSDGVRSKHMDRLKNILDEWRQILEKEKTKNRTPLRQVERNF